MEHEVHIERRAAIPKVAHLHSYFVKPFLLAGTNEDLTILAPNSSEDDETQLNN